MPRSQQRRNLQKEGARPSVSHVAACTLCIVSKSLGLHVYKQYLHWAPTSINRTYIGLFVAPGNLYKLRPEQKGVGRFGVRWTLMASSAATLLCFVGSLVLMLASSRECR